MFYYLAKVALGLAALFFGLSLFRTEKNIARIIGLITMLAGVVAVVLNIAAVRLGLGAVPLAGASGAIATFFAGCAVWHVSRRAA